MTSLSKDRPAKLQKDRQKNAKPTRVHKPKNKRVDKFDGVIYDDWYEQDIAEMARDENFDD